jgi:predicted nucleotidyltransferase
MTAVTEQLLDEMVQIIVREIDPEQVYLFGSRARGGAREDSDVDLLIVDSKSFGPDPSRFQEINRIYKALASFRVPTDILLYSSEEFAKWQHSLNHVIGRCYREGKLLYARSRIRPSDAQARRESPGSRNHVALEKLLKESEV